MASGPESIVSRVHREAVMAAAMKQQKQQQRRSVIAEPTAGKTKPLRIRIAIVGGETTGKSCIIKRYCEKRFLSKHIPTIGIDYGATKIYVDKREVSVHIFDNSGSNLFSEVRNEFYRDMHGILLVFDVTSRLSFDSLCDFTKEIYLELVKEGRNFDKTLLIVCGNKCDQKSRQVDDMEAKLWSELRGFSYFETSALTGQGINDMFHCFFSQLVRMHDEGMNGLPKTPTSARKIHNINKPSPSPVQQNKEEPKGPQPTVEQITVMKRLSQSSDPWHQLGLKVGCTKEEVNKVYRKLAMLLHPDKTAIHGADEAFKALGFARKKILLTLG